MITARKAWNWLVEEWQWPKAALFCGLSTTLLLLALLPQLKLTLFLICLQLPFYMIHQFEEHYEDRFRKFFNQQLGQGKEVLTPANTFIINSVFVWGVDLTAIYLAVFINPMLGLIAAYLTIVNAGVHVLQAVLTLSYNPGLGTGLVMFIPAGGYCIYTLSENSCNSWEYHAVALAIGILIHVGIIIHVRLRLGKLKAVAP